MRRTGRPHRHRGRPGLPRKDTGIDSDLGVRFDIVIGNSVATHLRTDEFLRFVGELTADGGVIALTYLGLGRVIPEGANETIGSEVTVLEWGIRRANPSTDSIEALLARGNAALRARGLTWVTLNDAGDRRLDPGADAPAPAAPGDARAGPVTGNGVVGAESPIYRGNYGDPPSPYGQQVVPDFEGEQQ